jgi:hypothetical protein
VNTVIGILCDRDGLASTGYLAQGPLGPEVRTRAWATPSGEVCEEQPSTIPVDYCHDGRKLGEVRYLERDEHGRLWCVAEVEAQPYVNVEVGDDVVPVATPMYFSVDRIGTADYRDLILRSVSITASPARVGARSLPLQWWPGGIDSRSGWHTDTITRGLLNRAAESKLRHRHNEPLRVHDWNYREAWRTREDAKPLGSWRPGGSGHVLSVS